jgi:hypothetical protein
LKTFDEKWHSLVTKLTTMDIFIEKVLVKKFGQKHKGHGGRKWCQKSWEK